MGIQSERIITRLVALTAALLICAALVMVARASDREDAALRAETAQAIQSTAK